MHFCSVSIQKMGLVECVADSSQRKSYESLSEPQKNEVLDTLGKMACAAAGILSKHSSEVIIRDTFTCQTCDAEQPTDDRFAHGDPPDFEDIWSLFNSILPRLTRIPGPRISAMVALRRILTHAPHSNQMHISTSASGEFCLHSLRSSIRELRIATACVTWIYRQLLILTFSLDTQWWLL